MFDNIKKVINKQFYKVISDKRVALIKLEGIIIDSSPLPVACKIIEALEDVVKQDIKAVVLKINSPGGTVGASQEIYSAVKRVQKEGVKVVVTMGDVAASGGLYVGVAGDKVVANPGTVTGSIGVILKNNIVKDLYKKIGVDQEVVKSGAFKDILSNTKYFSEEERNILQKMIDSTYSQFVEVIATERNLDIETVKSFADGRVFTGSQAKELGLVDEVGSQSDAVDIAAKLVGIIGKPKIVDISPKKSLLQKITGASLNDVLDNIGLSSVYYGVPLWIMPGF